MTQTNKKVYVPVTTTPFVLAYNDLFVPKSFEKANGALQEPKYSFTMIFNNESEYSNIIEAMKKCAQDAGLPYDRMNSPFKDGNKCYGLKEESMADKFPVFKDKKYARANSKLKINVLKYDRESKSKVPISKEEAHEMYFGCICVASLTISHYETPTAGFNIYADTIIKIGEGTRSFRDPMLSFSDEDLYKFATQVNSPDKLEEFMK